MVLMSKTTLSLQLLARLSNGALYKKSELAEFMEVKPRKLIELRNELIDAGYYIESIPGPYGGYRLDKSRSRMISIFNITTSELNSLKFIHKTTLEDSIHFKHFTEVLEKIEGYMNQHDHLEINVIQPIYHSLLKQKESDYFELLLKAIKNEERVECLYQSLDASIKKIYLKPYDLYFYKGFWYVITYNPKTKKAYHFKLVRMNEVINTHRKFDKDEQFKLSDFTGETSIFKGEEYDLELLITPPNAIIIRETQIAKNQQVIENPDGSILFKGTMEGKFEIISWLLSLGNTVKVIAPLLIKEAYKQEVKKMYEQQFIAHD